MDRTTLASSATTLQRIGRLAAISDVASTVERLARLERVKGLRADYLEALTDLTVELQNLANRVQQQKEPA